MIEVVMKRILRILAAVLALLTVVVWFVMGANRGWTHTVVPVKVVDEVTGIEGVQYRKQFVPGVDVLGAALLTAGLLAGASCLFRNSNKEIK
jgi:hypothetical protein